MGVVRGIGAGRPRKPTKQHKLNGNPSKLKDLGKGEPEPDVEVPLTPDLLYGESLEEWNRVTVELEALGLIAKIDEATLVMYCQAYAQYKEAQRRLKDDGPDKMVLRTATGYPIINPWWTVSNKAFEQVIRCANEFGFSPAARTRIRGDAKVPNYGEDEKGNKKSATGADRFLA